LCIQKLHSIVGCGLNQNINLRVESQNRKTYVATLDDYQAPGLKFEYRWLIFDNTICRTEIHCRYIRDAKRRFADLSLKRAYFKKANLEKPINSIPQML
jgi:hypothetical protein